MKHILAIPVRVDMEDFLAWHYDTKGVFLVKSTYHVLEDRKDREALHGCSSMATEASPINWLKLWILSYAPKIKTFYIVQLLEGASELILDVLCVEG